MERLIGIGLFIFSLIISCTPPPRPLRVVPLEPGPDALEVVAGGTISLTHDSVTIRLQNLDRERLSHYSVVVKPFSPEDYNGLFKQGYINYAEKDHAERLVQSRYYQNCPPSMQYDLFGQPLLEEGWKINPYLDKEGSILIFKMVIENRSPGKVQVTPSGSVMLDDQHRQYEPVSRQDWYGFFPLVWSPRFVVVPYGYGHQLVHYYLPRNQVWQGRIVDRSLLKDTKVYPQVTMEGLLVCPRVPEEVQQITLVIPEVAYFNQENQFIKKRDFTFTFKIANRPAS